MSHPSAAISYDRFSLIINGKPTLIRSGAMHYFRLPGADLWRDRLIKLKSAGYNTVDLYFNWGFHSSAPGEYDFTGPRDIGKLLEITRELGLHVIARPGPYINAETSGGGFPGWLLARRDLPLRNRRHGEFAWSDEYMDYVKEWWSHLFPILNTSSNIILMQIENEYATPEMEPDTIQALYKSARDLGAAVPLFHNDLYIAGLYEDLVDIYAFDNYPITQFTQSWRGAAETFQVIDQLEDTMRDYCMERPLMVAELQAGWFGGWKGERYEEIRESLDHEQLNIITKSVLAQGLTVFNHYMAIGGTNWNHMGSTEVYSSYDFAAPISENGIPAEHFYTAKAINQLLESFAEHWVATSPVKVCPVTVDDHSLFYKARHSEKNSEALWLFFRNLSDHPRETVVGLPPTLPSPKGRGDTSIVISLLASDMVVLPWNMPLQCGAQVDFSSTELLHQNEKLLVIKADRACHLHLSGLTQSELSDQATDISAQWHSETQLQIECPSLDPQSYTLFELPELNILFLGQSLIESFWVENEGSLLLGPKMLHLGDRIAISSQTTAITTLHSNGQLKNKIETTSLNKSPVVSATIVKTEFFNESPELAQSPSTTFKRVHHAGADFDANAVYEGSAWYRFILPVDAKKLTICAVHHWCAYLDGQYLGHGENFSTHPGQAEAPTDVDISLPSPRSAPGELTIFVSGLGHPKGFHDDAQTPQGIIRFQVDDQDCVLDLSILPQTCSQRVDHKQEEPKQDWTAIPVIRMETQFRIPSTENVYAPWSLKLDSAEFERLEILLNGVVIGKDWREGRRQDKFYLPESLLNDEVNRLDLIVMQFSEAITLQCFAAKPIKIRIEPYQVFQTIPLPL